MAKRNELGPKLTSSVVPQSDSLDRILQAVSLINSSGGLSGDNIDLSPRHINYVKHAARLLGLLADDGSVTPVGTKVTALAPPKQKLLLKTQFQLSTCGAGWLAYAKVSSLDLVDPESAQAFLTARSDLPEAMLVRRGRTLRSWCKQLRSAANTPKGTKST